jgi:hypothetical protein
MAYRVQENFCSRLSAAIYHEARFRWQNDKSGIYLFAIGVIVCSAYIAMMTHPSFASCANWSYYSTNPALLILGLGVSGMVIPLVECMGYLVKRVYQRTMLPTMN